MMVSFLASIGAPTLYHASRDVKILIGVRFVRLLGYGGTTFVLASYLSALGFSDHVIGLFMTATLVGDLGISFLLTYMGDRMGVRTTSAIGSLLMCVGGLAFAWFEDGWILLGASILAVINPSANEIDPFKAIEESAIARLSHPDTRNEIFAWWGLLGMLGTASSNLITGWALTTLQHRGVDKKDSYRAIFLLYALMGLVKLAGSLCLGREVEATCPTTTDGKDACPPDEGHGSCGNMTRQEDPLLEQSSVHSGYGALAAEGGQKPSRQDMARPRGKRLFTPRSFNFLWKLALAMFFDFVGSGLAQISWMTYFFQQTYGVNDVTLGSATFAAGIISSILNLASSPLSRAIGRVQTMVVCHTINSASLLMIAVPGNQLHLAMGLFMFRIITRELDNAPRQAFISAGVLSDERTSAMGVLNMVKILGSCLGLYLTGLFAAADCFWLAFVVAGALKLVYNLLVTSFFWGRERGHVQVRE